MQRVPKGIPLRILGGSVAAQSYRSDRRLTTTQHCFALRALLDLKRHRVYRLKVPSYEVCSTEVPSATQLRASGLGAHSQGAALKDP